MMETKTEAATLETKAEAIAALRLDEMIGPELVSAYKTDPVVAQALSIGDDITLAKRLSELVYVETPVDICKIAAYLARRSRLTALREIDPSGPAGDAAAYLLLALQGAFGQQMDVSHDRWVFDALVDAGLLPGEERDDIMAMRLRRKEVGVLEVAEAVRDGRGEAKV